MIKEDYLLLSRYLGKIVVGEMVVKKGCLKVIKDRGNQISILT